MAIIPKLSKKDVIISMTPLKPLKHYQKLMSLTMLNLAKLPK